MLAVYHMSYALSFIPAVVLNLTTQTAYYLFMQRYMFRRSVRLFYFPRVALFYLMFTALHEEIFIKRFMMNTYRVNVNDLFD